MRPSRRPTVTLSGRASIVAWFPQTPQPDAHHTHYRIRRFCEVMIVTPIGPGCCRAHPSARPSHLFALAPPGAPAPFSAASSRQRAYTRALVPGDEVAFFGRDAITVPVSPPPLSTLSRPSTLDPRKRGLCFFFSLTSLVPRCSPALGFSSPPGGASRKTWPWVTATTSSARLCRRPNARLKLAEVSSALIDVIIGRRAQTGASLVLLFRGENSPIKAAPTANPPVPVQKGLLSCLSACVATAELSSAIPIRGLWVHIRQHFSRDGPAVTLFPYSLLPLMGGL